jgi:hypothetical protein
VHKRVDFVKSQSSEIIETVHCQEDRWQQIRGLEELNFGIFSRGRAAKILAIRTRKDTWREINISLIRRSKKIEVRVARTHEV